MIELSIIIPCYNIEKYIERCISSVLNDNVELIIIDDGSTDKTLDICNDFKLKYDNIKVISIQNSGVSVARNIGLRHANGKYIWFIDGDDYIEKNIMQTIIDDLIIFDADVYCFAYNSVFPNYIKRSKSFSSGYQSDFFRDFLLGKYDVSMWNKIVKKEIISNIFFDKNIRINEDKLFCFEVFLNSKTVYYKDCAYYYYTQVREGNTKSVYFDNRYFDVLLVLHKMKLMIDRINNNDILNYYYFDSCKSIIGLYHRAILQKNNKINEKKIYEIIKKNRDIFFYNPLISKNRKIALFLIINMKYLYIFLYKCYFKSRKIHENKSILVISYIL